MVYCKKVPNKIASELRVAGYLVQIPTQMLLEIGKKCVWAKNMCDLNVNFIDNWIQNKQYFKLKNKSYYISMVYLYYIYTLRKHALFIFLSIVGMQRFQSILFL